MAGWRRILSGQRLWVGPILSTGIASVALMTAYGTGGSAVSIATSRWHPVDRWVYASRSAAWRSAASKVRDVVGRLIAAGHWRAGDLPILVVFDAGYDVTSLAWLLADLSAELLGRRSDRVMWLPAPPRRPGTNGRPRKHGRELALSDPAACPDPQITTSTMTSRYGIAEAAAWDEVHPRLTHRAAWLDHDGPLPVIGGTLIRLQVEHLPGDRDPKPVWLWWSQTRALPGDVDQCWQAFLRRFGLETSKPQCCHSRGWSALSLVPSRSVFMRAA
jgi:hypothetical protein